MLKSDSESHAAAQATTAGLASGVNSINRDLFPELITIYDLVQDLWNMTKREAIGQIRIFAEQDDGISDGALRLLFRICSYRFTDPKATMEKSFPVTWGMAAMWCFIKDADAAARRLNELVDRGYLKCDGVRGCPPKRYFFLTVNYRSKAVIDCRRGGVINTSSGGVNNSSSGGVDHISNSFQEEKIKRKREEINSSLRSTETNGGSKSSLRSGVTKGEEKAALRQMTDAERLQSVQAFQQLRRELETKTKTGSF